MRISLNNNEMASSDLDMIFSEGYSCCFSGVYRGREFRLIRPVDRQERKSSGTMTVKTYFSQIGLELQSCIFCHNDRLEETITMHNRSRHAVSFTDIAVGFTSNLNDRADWVLTAIPFVIQIDGNKHEYTGKVLKEGQFKNLVNGEKPDKDKIVYGNSVYSDPSRPEPEIKEKGSLRSEAWAWGKDGIGLVIIKYNNEEIEYSIAAPGKDGKGNAALRFGGAGFCLYGEPSGATRLEAGKSFCFGTTVYQVYSGGTDNAFYIYRQFLENQGHSFNETYNPPLNWETLYDIGWHHSQIEALKKAYTKKTLLKEAEKARECQSDLLYLDPGWEFAEGITIWDEQRLGREDEFIKTINQEYNLQVGFRTILRCFTNYWSYKFLARHRKEEEPYPSVATPNQLLWELCLCNNIFREEKLRRIVDVVQWGMKFIMFDDMDWRGICCDETHGHDVPVKTIDHIKAVYSLAREIKCQFPDVLIEVHDSVWPWHSCTYIPTYFQQGFSEKGCYHENWGFEFMWDCINDLKKGKALSLYYYNLGCSIPLYLHINMAADNDNCLFFWWAASTVRHLAIGGKESHPSIEPEGGLEPYDKERRYGSYKYNLRIYKSLKAYFCRGQFTGIAENIHLHTLKGIPGGVVNIFNVTERIKGFDISIPQDTIRGAEAKVFGTDTYEWTENSARLHIDVPPMCPALIVLGDAADAVKGLAALHEGKETAGESSV